MGEQLKSARREGGLVNAVMHVVWCWFVAIYMRLFHRPVIQGRENLPVSGPFLLVSNHASHLDGPLLASVILWRLQAKVFPVAAGDTFFSTRLTGVLSALLINALPMWRKRGGLHGLADLRDRLTQERCIYIVFPEGTRTRDGRMNRFRAGVGMLVAGTAVPVIPCHIAGTFEAWPRHRRLPRPVRVTLHIGNPLVFGGTSNDRGGWESVAGTLEASVIALGDRCGPAAG